MSTATPSAPFPSGPIRTLRGRAVAVCGDDIDTDRIIPARFLKCVTFEGLAEGAFADDRRELASRHPFDRSEHQGASILVVNRNFGCGSSREHAPQALMRWGIRAVVGESFSEIFFGNCLALGIPCVSASHEIALELQDWIAAHPQQDLELDLETLSLRSTDPTLAEAHWSLELAAGPHTMLLSGQWDATGQLLSHHGQLQATADRLPYLRQFAA